MGDENIIDDASSDATKNETPAKVTPLNANSTHVSTSQVDK